ncbi:hypothetical protein BCV69DRAFT_314598 [Microstroma glucosiphilum]|uniref:Mitochondrial escape protein 2 n=1 Tax=Pseudomicrostroma glucosiphilum TaxID=1684307 RepID=A0A316TZ48_9BASI|nr:hypothetical protein BCV69DRAFT_314598 [Pseudomicrostroma glucosiphilum]PWN18397.1 hypothetical protein BCV69DRAFT_314598 [Pseudomicrostroma glucosiphilum]
MTYLLLRRTGSVALSQRTAATSLVRSTALGAARRQALATPSCSIQQRHHATTRTIPRTFPRASTGSSSNSVNSRSLSTAELPGATLTPAETEHLAPDSPASRQGQIGYLYFDSLFPIRLGFWDIRHWFVATNHDSLKEKLRNSLPDKDLIGHDFEVIGAEARLKDGGGFLSFTYTPKGAPLPATPADTPDPALFDIETAVKKGLKRAYNPNQALLLSWGSIPSVHVVKGKPWLEDLNRFPSSTLKITLVGGDLSEEALWGILRPYGRIVSIEKKANEAFVLFSRMRSATSARNCAHGVQVREGPRLIINYKESERAKKAWDWTSNHPRIVFPILAFMLGGLSYAVWDPIRGFFIESKLSRTFDLDNYRLYSWLKANTVDLLREGNGKDESKSQVDWFERRAAKEDIQGWLRESPETFITISGPRGSGKHNLLEEAIPKGVKVLRIDCAEIARSVGSSGPGPALSIGDGSKDGAGKLDTAIIAALASETGYWPVFGWLNSLNSMIDLASVGLIGSKAGFSRPTEEQLSQILAVTKAALENVKRKEEKRVERERKVLRRSGAATSTSPVNGTNVPPPSAGSVDGNSTKQEDNDLLTSSESEEKMNLLGQEKGDDGPLAADTRRKWSKLPTDRTGRRARPAPKKSGQDDGISLESPIIIIDNFHLKSLRSPLLYSILVDWSSQLVSADLAHVIFVSDNPVAMSKEIGRALPDSRPANNVVLADAEKSKAREFVRTRLSEARGLDAQLAQRQTSLSDETPDPSTDPSMEESLSSSLSGLFGNAPSSNAGPVQAAVPASGEVLPEEDAQWVDKLGGRLTDLEGLLQKVVMGQTVPAAVSELITRTTVELRKSFFGDESSDTASTSSQLPWSRSTAWSVIRLLASSKDGSVPYHWMLHSDSGAFKGDEGKLRAMEEAELISVRHKDGRPSLIRAGRPVLLEAMKDLVHSDRTFRLTQELLDAKSSMAKSDAAIRDLEKELQMLVELSKVGGRGVAARVDSLAKKLEAEQSKLGNTEQKVGELQEELKKSE